MQCTFMKNLKAPTTQGCKNHAELSRDTTSLLLAVFVEFLQVLDNKLAPVGSSKTRNEAGVKTVKASYCLALSQK